MQKIFASYAEMSDYLIGQGFERLNAGTGYESSYCWWRGVAPQAGQVAYAVRLSGDARQVSYSAMMD